MTYQQIIVVGNLGRDPEMRYTPAGKAVTNFSVADGRKWTDRDGVEHDETLWFRVSVWDKQAEACNQYLKKGSMVLVEGRITGDPETGGPKIYPRNDGFAGASFEISATTVRFLSKKEGDAKVPAGNRVRIGGAQPETSVPDEPSDGVGEQTPL